MNMKIDVRLVEPCLGLVLVVVLFSSSSQVAAISGMRSVEWWSGVVG